jgi:hypothetical protein
MAPVNSHKKTELELINRLRKELKRINEEKNCTF